MSGLTIYEKEGQAPILSRQLKTLLRPEIGLVVKYICTITGITNVPDSYESKVLVDFMLAKYSNYGIMEFKTAFDMYVEGKLPKRDNESHYNTVSAAFIGSVMQKYQSHRIKEKRKIENEIHEPPEKPVYTAETYENAYNYAVGYITKHNSLPIGGHYLHVYDHFKAAGLGWYRLEDKERRELKTTYMETVRKQLTAQAREQSAAGNIAKAALSNKEQFKYECRGRYIKEQLSKLIK